MATSPILIEGLTPDELIALDELEALAATGKPIVFRIGSAEVLAGFSILDRVLDAQLSVIENGGEGILMALIGVIEKSVASRDIIVIEWSVYARNCATPNPKLERILLMADFEIREYGGGVEFYWQRRSTNRPLRHRSRT